MIWGQAQNKFIQFLEKTLQDNSSPDFINNSASDPSILLSIQKIYDNLDSLVFILKETSQNQSQVYTYMQSLTEQVKELKNNSREQDKKLSNFLSTQLNIQSNMLQLTEKLNKDGIIDKQTKKYFANIDNGIQKLISQSKKR